jgi:hypothetical protein
MRRPSPSGARSVASARRHVAVPGAASHGVAASFRVFLESAYPVIGSGIPPHPCPKVGLEVFRALARTGPRYDKSGAILSWTSVPLQSVAATASVPPWRNRHSRGVPSLSAHAASGVHSTRACLTRYVPPPGFLTLLTASSSRRPPALFHAGGTRRVSPFGAFPFRRSRGPHRTRSTRLPSTRRSGSRVLIPPEVRRPP